MFLQAKKKNLQSENFLGDFREKNEEKSQVQGEGKKKKLFIHRPLLSTRKTRLSFRQYPNKKKKSSFAKRKFLFPFIYGIDMNSIPPCS